MESFKEEEEEEEEAEEGEEGVVKMEVKEELKVEEVEVKLHSCDTCGFTSSRRLLRRHMRREHRGLQQLPCTLCAFTTPWKVTLSSSPLHLFTSSPPHLTSSQ